MFRDIAIPNDNEEEFAAIALKLGWKKLFFLYDFDEFRHETEKNLEKLNIDFEIGFIVDKSNVGSAFKKSKLLAAKSSADDRALMEGKKIKLFYGFEDVKRKDYLHQRASGLNHVLCDIANKNNIAVGFSYSLLLGKNAQDVSVIKGRMMQNISLCQKYKVKMAIGSFSSKPYEMRNPRDLAALFEILGMKQDRLKEAFTSNL